jgi:Flp pilus assembly protein TadD
MGLRDVQQATTMLERARELNPTEAVVYYQLARVYKMAGREKDAQEALQKQKELLAHQN